MKKVFSISFAFLILLAGMHVSVATHFCGGEVASVKWSFSEEKATCGMENDDQSYTSQHTVKSNCCRNEVTVYSTDNNYNSTSIQLLQLTQKLIQVFDLPVNNPFSIVHSSFSLLANISPPGNLLATFVSLSNVCTFRI